MDDDGCGLFLFVILVMVGAFCLGIFLEKKDSRHDAVEAGVAEYYIDENNDRAFRYLEVGPCDETTL